MHHYRCGRHFIEDTLAIIISANARIFPAHTRIPTILKDDLTVLAAEELAMLISETIKLGCADRIQHINYLKFLIEILMNKPKPADAGASRVSLTSTSNVSTAAKMIKKTRQIHQRTTWSNTPMTTIIKDIDNAFNSHEGQ